MSIEGSTDICCTILLELQMTAMETTQSYLIILLKNVRSSPTTWTNHEHPTHKRFKFSTL